MLRLLDETDRLRDKNRRLQNGNTSLIEALMDMCAQYLVGFHTKDDGNVCTHDFMSAGEGALGLLEDAGLASSKGDVYYTLDFDKLEERVKASRRAAGMGGARDE